MKTWKAKSTSTNGNSVSNVNTYNLLFISFVKLISHRFLYEIPVDCRRYDFFFFCGLVVDTWRWGSNLPGLDRGASDDLSFQALKSDADLWKTKGTGRGTNMVLCRSEGRWVSLYFVFYPSFVLVGLWPFPVVSGALRGKLCWFKIGLWLLRLGSDLFFSGSHLSFYYFWDTDEGCRYSCQTRSDVQPSFVCLFVFWNRI